MKNMRKKRIQPYTNKLFPILILISVIFMGIGYASVNSVIMNINGTALAKNQDGIYITEVNYVSDVDADLNNTKILSANQTNIKSTITLSKSNPNSAIIYNVKIFNSSKNDYSYLNYEYISEMYDNENIVIELNNLNRGDIIHSGETIEFTIRFKYINNVDLTSTKNTLNSYINFDFKLRPEIVIGSYVNGYNHRLNENNETISTKYISPASRNGGTWDAIYTIDGVSNYDPSKLEWRVIGCENDQLIITTTDEITSENGRHYQSIRGKIGYTYMISEMNNISSIYGQGKYADISKYTYNLDGINISSGARSIKLEDLGYKVESINNRTYTYKYSSTDKSKLVVWYSNPLENPTEMLESEYTFLEYFDETNTTWISLEKENQSVTIPMNNYNEPTMTELQHQMIYQGSDGSNLKYFLATRYIHVDDENFILGRIGYGAPYVQDDSTVFGHGIYWSNGTAAGAPRTVRPVVYLKSNVIIDYDKTTGIYNISY